MGLTVEVIGMPSPTLYTGKGQGYPIHLERLATLQENSGKIKRVYAIYIKIQIRNVGSLGSGKRVLNDNVHHISRQQEWI